MLSVLLSFLVLALLGIVIPFLGLVGENTYGSNLEEYIVNGRPQDTADVERLERDYQTKALRKFL